MHPPCSLCGKSLARFLCSGRPCTDDSSQTCAMVSGHHRQRSTREIDGEVTQPEYVRLASGQRYSSFRWAAQRQAMLETSSYTVSKWHIQKIDGELMESMDQVAKVGFKDACDLRSSCGGRAPSRRFESSAAFHSLGSSRRCWLHM